MGAGEVSDDVRLEPIERLEDVREDWSALADRSGHPFATWEWNSLWWEKFGAGRELYSFVCRDADGSALAILPLYVVTSRPVGIARFLGYSDLHSPVCAPEHRALAAEALVSVTRLGRVRLVLAERLPGEQGWGPLVGGRVIREGHDPVLRFEGTWEEFLASRSRNFRARERKLLKETGVTYRLSDEPDGVRDDMDTLFRLHGERWGDETTGVFAGDRADFHREFAVAALERGWLRLWLAEIEGKPVAAWYGWRFANCEWYFQSGRVTDYDRLSLGFVLITHSVREAWQDGMDAYHFLAGDESYKARLTEEDPGAESRLVGSGPLVAAGALAYRAAESLPGSLQRRLTGS
jgi:CelD/BcsL family acetyltransferase involved in cellulose biosynthesis